ncbi:MAG: HD-GYP domain-containing protein [Fimbriimonadaceae bacterium]|nr:HD-GYP domain-containing protein [Fimbriimonadaceae bacterium]
MGKTGRGTRHTTSETTRASVYLPLRLSSGGARPSRGLIVSVLLVLAIGAWASTTLPTPESPDMGLCFGLSVLALLASRFGYVATEPFTPVSWRLPFVAAIAVVAGPVWALMTDLLAFVLTPVRSRYIGGREHVDSESAWALVALVGFNVVSAFAMGLFLQLGGLSQTLVYSGVYLVINAAWMVALSSRRIAKRLGLVPHGLSWTGAWQWTLILTFAFSAGVLVEMEMPGWSALILLPVLASRMVAGKSQEIDDHYYGTITALTLMLQRAHPYSHRHIERVSLIAEEVALRLGLNRKNARLVREAAVLHDIGKIAVDEEILDKPSKLDVFEMDHVRQHSAFGAEILSPVVSLKPIVPWIRHHHERLDGDGYPDGLVDVEIPIESKIIAVVDAYDAMTGGNSGNDKRPYRDPMSVDQALSELVRCSGTQFDPDVVQAFREVIEEDAH